MIIALVSVLWVLVLVLLVVSSLGSAGVCVLGITGGLGGELPARDVELHLRPRGRLAKRAQREREETQLGGFRGSDPHMSSKGFVLPRTEGGLRGKKNLGAVPRTKQPPPSSNPQVESSGVQILAKTSAARYIISCCIIWCYSML